MTKPAFPTPLYVNSAARITRIAWYPNPELSSNWCTFREKQHSHFGNVGIHTNPKSGLTSAPPSPASCAMTADPHTLRCAGCSAAAVGREPRLPTLQPDVLLRVKARPVAVQTSEEPTVLCIHRVLLPERQHAVIQLCVQPAAGGRQLAEVGTVLCQGLCKHLHNNNRPRG